MVEHCLASIAAQRSDHQKIRPLMQSEQHHHKMDIRAEIFATTVQCGEKAVPQGMETAHYGTGSV